MPQYNFGAGSLWGVRNDVSGPQTPRKFAILQDVHFDFSRTIKQLMGSYNLPVALGPGTIKTSAKAKAARIMAGVYADLYFGVQPAPGQILVSEDEQHNIPAATPFTVTITPPGSGTFKADLGVWYQATGEFLSVTDTPSQAGEYSVDASTGEYTFDTADEGLSVMISYSYTVTTGQQITITGQFLGVAPTFLAMFKGTYGGKQATLQLNSCMSEKLSFATKLEDFTIPEFDFQFSMDASNTVGILSLSE